MSVVQLNTVSWGSPSAPRRALLVHGLGSDAHTMWQIGGHLATRGWLAVAVDQRGHGSSPRTASYRIDDYAGDLLAHPRERPWDLVIGHSIGGASVVRASARETGWAAAIVLIDPALATTEADRDEIATRQLHNHRTLTQEKQAADNPHWHPTDIEVTVNAQRTASEIALLHSVTDNPDWDVLVDACALAVPTLVFQGDPSVLARYTDAHAARIEVANPLVTRAMIPGTGHSLHRDAPREFCAALDDWLDF